jgi:hypothetical protein
VMTDAAKAAEQRQDNKAQSRLFFKRFLARRGIAGLRRPAYSTASGHFKDFSSHDIL